MSETLNTPLFGLMITVLAYVAARWLHSKFSWLHPLVAAPLAVLGVLGITQLPYEDYAHGGDLVSFWLGPATVALAVPLYKQLAALRSSLGAILLGVLAGSLVGMAVAWALVVLLGGTQDVLLTMLTKSVTTPIMVELLKSLGSDPGLGAVLTVLTGLFGSVVGPGVLRLCGIRDEVAQGVAIGTAAHGIGTARVVLESELQGSASGFAMGLTGIAVSLLVIPLQV
jgi:predicted murein hydrolase (TIGR00659 family)